MATVAKGRNDRDHPSFGTPIRVVERSPVISEPKQRFGPIGPRGQPPPAARGPFDPEIAQVVGRMIRCLSQPLDQPDGGPTVVSFSTSLTSTPLTSTPLAGTSLTGGPSRTAPLTNASFTPLANLTTATTEAPHDRLAELVHHLSDAPLAAARRAVQHHRPAGQVADPLAVVAAAIGAAPQRTAESRRLT